MPTQSFTSQSGWQKFSVPKGVDRVTVDLKGAGSGTAKGGRVRGQIRVKDSDVLYLLVGEAGKAPSGRQGGAPTVGGGGGGGDGSSNRDGGRSGGGAAAIRLNSRDGTLKAVAGGAGGKSGDEGASGDGGGPTGQHGSLSSGLGQVGNATGGTQTQGGNGGVSSAAPGLAGGNAPNSGLARGGRGGQLASQDTHGGGGGGGGYRAGGGGAAALIGVSAGGGGGGGSNFTGGLFTGVSSEQGGGGTGDATIVISWIGPPPADQPPQAPSDVKVDGKSESSGMGTKSTGKVEISALVRDPTSKTIDPVHTGDPATQKHSKARLVVRYSAHSNFANASQVKSDFVEYGKRATVNLTGLAQSTHYYARLFAEDPQGKRSENYNSVNFWTNRNPVEPKLQAPGNNGIILVTDTTVFDWSHQDPDPDDGQSAFEIRWRRAQSGDRLAGNWVTHQQTTSFDNYSVDPGVFKAGDYYDWTVRTRDEQKAWGPFAIPRSFYVLGTAIPPILRSPINNTGLDVSVPVVLKWKFRDPSQNTAQVKADYRFRVVGENDWVTVFGDATTPGAEQTWTIPIDTFTPGVRYEWQMRTYTSAPLPSDWSDSETFWAHGGLGSLAAAETFDFIEDQGTLGCGDNRAFIYDRGGRVLRGEVTPLTNLTWTRQRDDIGTASITTNGFGDDCGDLLRTVHTWIYELVIFRDGVRVFEGPITLIEDSTDGFTIQAKDVMGYVYRRIMRQGYNDSYHEVNGVVEGLLTVVERAGLILADALSRNDPNVLPYVSLLTYDDDARESRVVPDFGKTAWEEIDDMAANAGLDYSVIGRRIILNDTHRPVGRLPEFRSDFFSDAPKITEYGMLLADFYAVTNNAGLWGAVERTGSPYGGIEMLVSSFGENGAGAAEVMTKAKQDSVRKVLVEQAKRGIASRYPAPYIVRVPDNSMLMPEVPIGINQLVPGVWIPLRAQGTLIEISQWQKLDQVTVTQTNGQEQVRVTMSPAPNQGQDPDADAEAEEAAS